MGLSGVGGSLVELAAGFDAGSLSGLVQRDQVAHTLASLESVNGRVLGIVLNRTPAKGGAHYGSYSYTAPDVSATRRERKRVELA